MTQPKPPDPTVDRLLDILQLVIDRLLPGQVPPEIEARLRELEAWKSESAGVYPTVGDTQ